MSVGVTIALWFLLRRKSPTRRVTALAIAGLAVASGLGSLVTLALVPAETFTVSATDLTVPGFTAEYRTFVKCARRVPAAKLRFA